MASANQPWHWGRELNIRSGGQGAGRQQRCLVVFVHGLFPYVAGRWIYRRLIDHFDDVLQSRFEQREYLLFAHPGTYWSPSDPEWIVRNQLLPQITEATSRTDYDSIILTAHSFGGLLLRRLVLTAATEPWFSKVERIVLMASPTRGFKPVTLVQQALVWLSGTVLDRAGNPGRLRIGRLARSGMKGSPWMDDLWSRWTSLYSTKTPPPTIHLVGARDSLVSQDDDAELRQFPTYQTILLPLIGHNHFTLEVRPQRSREANDKNLAAIVELREVIAQALALPDLVGLKAARR